MDCKEDRWVAYRNDYCECASNEYWHEVSSFCIECPEGCGSCDTNAIGLVVCHSCLMSYYLSERSGGICYEVCPYGDETANDGVCDKDVGISIFAVSIEDNSGDGLLNQSLASFGRTISLYGGSIAGEEEYCDPFISSDRGAWFDGMYTYATFENLILPESFEIRAWIRAHGDGALFSSSSSDDDRSAEKFIALLIDNGTLTFVDTQSGIYFEAAQKVKNYWWHYVEVHVSFVLLTGTTVQFVIDSVPETTSLAVNERVVDNHDGKSVHRMGVMEFREHNENYYKGYIWSFELSTGLAAGTWDINSTTCIGTCTECPGDTFNTCLGICNWSHYWNAAACQRCNSTCVKGCNDSGECTS
jgi:hypothetical protein